MTTQLQPTDDHTPLGTVRMSRSRRNRLPILVVICVLAALGLIVARQTTRSAAPEVGPVVTGSYDLGQPSGTVLTGRGMSASLTVPPGTFAEHTQLILKERGSSEGPPPPPSTKDLKIARFTSAYDVVASRPGTPVLNDWRLPVEITFRMVGSMAKVPDFALIVCLSQGSRATDWKEIHPVSPSTTSLAENESAGYFITHTGNSRVVHILAKQGATYAVFRTTFVGPVRPPK